MKNLKLELAEHHRAEIIGQRYSFFDDDIVEPNIRAAESGREMFHGADPLTRR